MKSTNNLIKKRQNVKRHFTEKEIQMADNMRKVLNFINQKNGH